MDLNLELPVGLDPHVETSREELELALKEVYDRLQRDESTVMGTGNSKLSSAGPHRNIWASSTATDFQQADAILAADSPCSEPYKVSWPGISRHNASDKGAGGEGDLLTTINFTSDEVYHGETGIFRQPRNTVSPSFSILPLEQLTGIFKDKHESVEGFSPKSNYYENDAPICKLTHDEKHYEEVTAIATQLGNGFEDNFLEKRISETLRVDCPSGILKPPSVHKEHPIGNGSAEVEFAGPIEAAQRLLVENHGPKSGSSAVPTTFSGLFQSILALDNHSSQLVETASLPSGLLAAPSTVSAVNNQAVKDIANTTTRLILDSLSQFHRIPEPPGLLRLETGIESRNRMKPSTAVPAQEARSESLPIRSASETFYQDARVASAATTVSAAASAAKAAVQAAELSIEALANLGINNGSLYQGRNRFLNPQPLQVACGSRPMAAGVKRTFPDQRTPIVKQNGGKSTPGSLDLIRIGSNVEVMPDEDGLQGGWFIAKVLSMTPKEALVVYDDMMTDDGSTHLEESFPLHCSREEDKFGTTVSGAQGWIRPVHPYSSSMKRGHFTMDNENWVVGDLVDAFVDEGWWEGIIEDLNEADETRITIFFPGDSSTMVVRSWNVRPSLVWKKGEWRPCRGDSVEQDGPPSKRQKTSTTKGRVEREQTSSKVAAVRNPAQTPEPLAIAPMKQSLEARKSSKKGVVLHSKNAGTGHVSITPGRELRSRTRSNSSTAQRKEPVKSSKTPASKKSTGNTPTFRNTSSPLTRSQQIEVAVTPDFPWDVRRQSTRLQQKVATQSPPGLVRGKTPSSRSSKSEVLMSPNHSARGKTPSRKPRHKSIEAPLYSAEGLALALIPQPTEVRQTRARTRLQILAATKG